MDINDPRRVLDDLDSILIETLARRMSYIPDVAKYKGVHHVARYQPEREDEVIHQHREQAVQLGLNPDLAEEVMRTVIKYAHLIEKQELGEEP